MSVKNAGGVARASGASGLRGGSGGTATGVGVRPVGYEYPVGLNTDRKSLPNEC